MGTKKHPSEVLFCAEICRSSALRVFYYNFKMYKQAFQKAKSDTKFAVYLQYTIFSSNRLLEKREPVISSK